MKEAAATTAAALVRVVLLLALIGHYAQGQERSQQVMECPWPCPSYKQPVCGNNGKTYQNPCYLSEATTCENSCIKQRHIGPCEEVCPDFCTEIYQPVCGTDGRTYSNTCYLSMKQCEDPCIEFLHDGECGTNQGCRKVCMGMNPVCGSDGATYRSQCHLDNAACDQPCIKKVADGPCGRDCGDLCPLPQQQQEAVCGSDGTTYLTRCHLQEAACSNPCLVMQHEGPCDGPRCPKICVLNFAPVCGSDGKTYSNLCLLHAAAECDNPCITFRSNGPCSRECGDSCPISQQQEAVCGTDGTTYISQCHLEEAACLNPCLTVQREGPCDFPQCPMVCHFHLAPVCGTDGKTYENLCLLNSATQCVNSCIRLRREGPCSRTCGDICPLPRRNQEVCGTDGNTYLSQCFLEEAACHNPCLTVLHRGRCDRAGCPIECPAVFNPVCGSDGKTYPSMCYLDAATQCENSCITLRRNGPCSRECGDPCPLPVVQEEVCGSDGVTYISRCHLMEVACQNPCLKMQHEGPCGAPGGSDTCCMEGEMILPNMNVLLSCQNGEITGVPLGGPDPFPSICEFEGRGYPSGARLGDLCFPMICTQDGWSTTGAISDCCGHCHLHGDLHVFTFDNTQYDFHVACNFSVTQTGSSHDPTIGVFTHPKPCKDESTTCFGYTTFRNDPNTVITIHHDYLTMVNVNGYNYEVAETGVQVLTNGVSPVPVLVWRGDCGIYMAGSSGIVLLACPHRLDVWASSSLLDQLDGLCGSYDRNPDNDFRGRSGKTYPIQDWPFAFPVSWATDEQTDNMCDVVYVQQPHHPDNLEDPCTANKVWRNVYKTTCEKQLAFSDMFSTTISVPIVYNRKYYIRTCGTDICVMHTGGSTHEAIQEWLNILRQNFAVSRSLGEKVMMVPGLGSNVTTGIADFNPTKVLPHCQPGPTSPTYPSVPYPYPQPSYPYQVTSYPYPQNSYYPPYTSQYCTSTVTSTYTTTTTETSTSVTTSTSIYISTSTSTVTSTIYTTSTYISTYVTTYTTYTTYPYSTRPYTTPPYTTYPYSTGPYTTLPYTTYATLPYTTTYNTTRPYITTSPSYTTYPYSIRPYTTYPDTYTRPYTSTYTPNTYYTTQSPYIPDPYYTTRSPYTSDPYYTTSPYTPDSYYTTTSPYTPNPYYTTSPYTPDTYYTTTSPYTRNPYYTTSPYTPDTYTSTYTSNTYKNSSCDLNGKNGCPTTCVPIGTCDKYLLELTWPYLCGEGCACCI